jgi:hypothetical protein
LYGTSASLLSVYLLSFFLSLTTANLLRKYSFKK